MTYRIISGDRRQVVKLLEEMVGRRAEYTRMPHMAYVIEGIVVKKDCTVTLEEGARMDLVAVLLNAGLISPIASAQTPIEEESLAKDTAEEQGPPSYENLIERMDDQEDGPDVTLEAEHITFSFPLADHRPESIINLVSTIYTRGKLISKATGGTFFAKEELVDILQVSGWHTTLESVLSIIMGEGGLGGLSFTEDNAIFDGFPATTDTDTVHAWQALCEAINRNAIKQAHVRAKEIDDTNERFAFRTWLTRLGMNGPELKKERLLLYRNLSGNTAFRTDKDLGKWKARKAAKRQEHHDEAES